MKSYIFKIQWVFNNNKGDIKNCCNVLKAIGVRGLDIINFRDKDFKIIDNYHGFIMYQSDIALLETIKYIKKAIKNEKVFCVEILKK